MTPRLFIDESLYIGKEIKFVEKQFHYIINVLRNKVNDELLLINGKDGEFLANIIFLNNKYCIIKIIGKIKDYKSKKFLGLIFAPIQKIDLLLKGATEVGVTDFLPINTEFTNKTYSKLNRIEGNIVEAVEQSERLDIPKVHKIKTIKEVLDDIDQDNNIIFFCEERSGKNNPLEVYKTLNVAKKNIYALVGPEGGFSEKEKEEIKSYKNVVSINLGDNILRAETAVISILTLINAFYINS